MTAILIDARYATNSTLLTERVKDLQARQNLREARNTARLERRQYMERFNREYGHDTGAREHLHLSSAGGGASTGQMLTEAFVPGTAYYNLGYAAEAQGRYLAAFGWHTAGHLEVLGTFATAGVGGVLVGTTRGATAAVRGSAAAYSVAFETTIAKVGAGTRPAHFAAANRSLAAAMSADAGFAKMMDDLAIKIPSEFGRSPAGWTWHHVPDQPGVMQLVPRAQHQGGPWQSILHPGGKGGFSLWGTDF